MTDQCLTIEQLREYISESYSESEMKAAETHLANCELCSSALESIEKAFDAEIFDKNQFESFENAFKQEVDNKAIKERKNVLNHAFFKYAAIFLLLLNVGTFTYFSLSNKQSASQFQAYHFTERGRTESPDILMDEAMAAYQSRSYEEAIEKLNLLPRDHEQLELIIFLKANAYAASGQKEKAIAAFEKMLSNESWTIYREQVRSSLKELY